MKFENTEVFNFNGALRGMRNPMNSWNKSDSSYDIVYKDFYLGDKDLELAQSLIRAGSEHRKFLRQIFVSVDITAPLFWWKEFDTYKVGTVSNSTSTMHKLSSTPITRDCFEMDDYENISVKSALNNSVGDTDFWWEATIEILESLRKQYNETKDKRYWQELIRLLPESWLQKRTITMNYENILNMVRQRSNHKLSEWSISFIDWAKTLPYAEELLFLEK